MSSTNKTTHYELPQYIGTDKPTYLIDFNQAMAIIDAGIYAAKLQADTNKDNIGTMLNLETTIKSSLVGAINEVNSMAINIGTLSNLNTTDKSTIVNALNEVNSLAIGIGTLSNLNTTNKNNIVSSINEIVGNIGALSSLDTTTKASIVNAINELKTAIDNFNLTSFTTLDNEGSTPKISTTDGTLTGNPRVTIAKNSDGSLAKIYGAISFNPNKTGICELTITGSGLTPSSEFNIENAGFVRKSVPTGFSPSPCDITLKTNGDIIVSVNVTVTQVIDIWLQPMLYWIKDFGDIINPVTL